jgi:hypothetical protein
MSKDERIEEQFVGEVSNEFEREGGGAAQRYRDHAERHRVDPLAGYQDAEWAKIELYAGDNQRGGWVSEPIKLDEQSTRRLLRFLEGEPCPCWLCGRRTPSDGVYDFRGLACCRECWNDLARIASGKPEPGEVVPCPC